LKVLPLLAERLGREDDPEVVPTDDFSGGLAGQPGTIATRPPRFAGAFLGRRRRARLAG